MLTQSLSKLIRNRFALLNLLCLVALFWSVSACKEEQLTTYDPAKQAAADETLIKEYLANDSTMRQAKRTESGIYYATLKPGTGPLVKLGNKVNVHYIGRFLNGSKFDSSYDRAQYFEVTVGETAVIQGWTEGLQLMSEGETTRFYIPSGLAYGPRGSGSNIPANAVLVFDIKVVNIIK